MKKRSVAGRLQKGLTWLLFFGFMCLSACSGGSLASPGALGTERAAAQVGGEEQPEQPLLLPEASGTVVYEGEGVTIDASHTDQGYVMIRCESGEKRLKARIATEAQTYYYDLPGGDDYSVFPLQMGDGAYTVRVMEQVEDDLYAVRYGAQISVRLAAETLPFLYPNQYVWYDADTLAVSRARELTIGVTSDREVARALYRFVVKHMTYDTEKAATVPNEYLPDAEESLETGKGICFDYAELLAVMLRSEGIPAQVVIGTVMPENLYHAWNSVYIDGAWVWMDPTFDRTRLREKDYITDRVY